MPEIDRSNLALGKQPPSNKVAVLLKDILTGVVPATPVAVDHFAEITTWNLGGNNDWGTCGPTGVSNHLLLVTTYLGGVGIRVSDEDIFDLYRRSGNPRFDPDLDADDPNQQDGGVVLQEMLGELLRNGIGQGPDGQPYKPLAYAKIEPGDMDTLDKAVAIFGGILLGLDLKAPQQSQQVWDYVPNSREWGGHCTMAGRYRNPDGTASDRTGQITWAEAVDMTHEFVAQQEDEAWVIIWPQHLGSAEFLEGVNVEALASAYEDLTHRPFPLPAPQPQPNPQPNPQPQPAPAPDPAGGDVDQAHAQVLRRLLKSRSLPRYARTDFDTWLDRLGG